MRIIDRLGASAARNAKSLAIQKALARCSHLLLTSRDEDGDANALAALLDATEADYAYIDVNSTEDDGRIDLADQSRRSRRQRSRRSQRIRFGQLRRHALGAGGTGSWVDRSGSGWRTCPNPSAARYQAEGIRSELAAPIMIEGKWVGTIGFSDFWREGNWTDLETEALTTAADMVAGAWERDRAREGLQELAEAKDRFIAAVSHELRTPLSAVVGFAAALRDAAGAFRRRRSARWQE